MGILAQKSDVRVRAIARRSVYRVYGAEGAL